MGFFYNESVLPVAAGFRISAIASLLILKAVQEAANPLSNPL